MFLGFGKYIHVVLTSMNIMIKTKKCSSHICLAELFRIPPHPHLDPTSPTARITRLCPTPKRQNPSKIRNHCVIALSVGEYAVKLPNKTLHHTSVLTGLNCGEQCCVVGKRSLVNYWCKMPVAFTEFYATNLTTEHISFFLQISGQLSMDPK